MSRPMALEKSCRILLRLDMALSVTGQKMRVPSACVLQDRTRSVGIKGVTQARARVLGDNEVTEDVCYNDEKVGGEGVTLPKAPEHH